MRSFNRYVEDLKRSMVQDYVSVNPGKNPIYTAKNSLTSQQLEYVIGQYSVFPRHIVHFLSVAKEKLESQWPVIGEEIERNIGEESGSQTDGVSHYDLLARGFEKDADLTLTDIEGSPSTSTFIIDMEAHVSDDNNAYIAGATYALESSAVPELKIVKDLATLYIKKKTGRKMSPDLEEFFHMHTTEWEPGHEKGLRDACQEDIGTQPHPAFSEGFHVVMRTMDRWWRGLYGEMSFAHI